MNSPPDIARRGLLFVLSSPSGAGKTTLSRRLLGADPEIRMSVSVTTRSPRPGEVEGLDYLFRSTAEFERMKAQGALLEHAVVHQNCYGTPKEPVMAALSAGRDVLFDIDWQGCQQLREKLAADLVSVFILPPSAAALAERLRTRAQDPPDVVARRLAGAPAEIARWREYDYIIVNRDLDRSFAQVQAILEAERLKRLRQPGIGAFVEALLGEFRRS